MIAHGVGEKATSSLLHEKCDTRNKRTSESVREGSGESPGSYAHLIVQNLLRVVLVLLVRQVLDTFTVARVLETLLRILHAVERAAVLRYHQLPYLLLARQAELVLQYPPPAITSWSDRQWYI